MHGLCNFSGLCLAGAQGIAFQHIDRRRPRSALEHYALALANVGLPNVAHPLTLLPTKPSDTIDLLANAIQAYKLSLLLDRAAKDPNPAAYFSDRRSCLTLPVVPSSLFQRGAES